MLHGDGDNEEHGYCPVGQFILQNLGLLLGFAIMLVIALYEDKIVLDIQFWPNSGHHSGDRNVTVWLWVCTVSLYAHCSEEEQRLALLTQVEYIHFPVD